MRFREHERNERIICKRARDEYKQGDTKVKRSDEPHDLWTTILAKRRKWYDASKCLCVTHWGKKHILSQNLFYDFMIFGLSVCCHRSQILWEMWILVHKSLVFLWCLSFQPCWWLWSRLLSFLLVCMNISNLLAVENPNEKKSSFQLPAGLTSDRFSAP